MYPLDSYNINYLVIIFISQTFPIDSILYFQYNFLALGICLSDHTLFFVYFLFCFYCFDIVLLTLLGLLFCFGVEFGDVLYITAVGVEEEDERDEDEGVRLLPTSDHLIGFDELMVKFTRRQ